MKSNDKSQDLVISTVKYKITFDILRVQNLQGVKGRIWFVEHHLVIKVDSSQNNDKRNLNVFETLKNLLQPIFSDEENNIFINYCLINNFTSSNGMIQFSVYNPVYKRSVNINIVSIEKSAIIFSSTLKIEEINKITKFINSKIILEVKFMIEEFLLMINNFREVFELQELKTNETSDEKIYKSINETRKFYNKYIKELKKSYQMKNDVNNKILKEKISENKIDRNSIAMLSLYQCDNFSAFDSVSPEIRFRGFKLIEENISLFFEITSLENNILNLKRVDKLRVSDNLKTLQKNNFNNNYNNQAVNINSCSSNNAYKPNSSLNFNNNGNNPNSNNFNNNKGNFISDIKFINNKYSSYQSGWNTKDSARFSKTPEKLNTTNIERRKNNMDIGSTKNSNTDKKTGDYNTNYNKLNKSVNQIKQEIRDQTKSVTNIRKTGKMGNSQTVNKFINDNMVNKNNFAGSNFVENIYALQDKKPSDNDKPVANKNIYPTKKFIESDTITDVNGLVEDMNNQNNNNNYFSNSSNCFNNNFNNTGNDYYFNNGNFNQFFIPNNSKDNIFEIYNQNKNASNYPGYEYNDLEADIIPNSLGKTNFNSDQHPNAEESENFSSSTKTNSKKEEGDSLHNKGINYINRLKEMKENHIQNDLETPKFCNKSAMKTKKSRLNEIENINFSLIAKRINVIKENHLFLENNCPKNIVNNCSELFCRKYFEYTFELHFPKFFSIERDSNGIVKTDAFYSYLFYLRGLKNHLFTDENKIQFSNVFFLD